MSFGRWFHSPATKVVHSGPSRNFLVRLSGLPQARFSSSWKRRFGCSHSSTTETEVTSLKCGGAENFGVRWQPPGEKGADGDTALDLLRPVACAREATAASQGRPAVGRRPAGRDNHRICLCAHPKRRRGPHHPALPPHSPKNTARAIPWARAKNTLNIGFNIFWRVDE